MGAGGVDDAHAQVILIRVLDGFSVETSLGMRITIKNRKACALLGYLALNRNHVETRERLAGLLWSDRGEEQARASLRQCLKQLRGVFHPINCRVLRMDRQEVAISPQHIQIDLEQATTKRDDGQLGAGLVNGIVVPERILYGLEELDEAYAAWLHVIRKRWGTLLVDQLQSLMRDQNESRSIRRRSAEALVNIDQSHEEAQRFLITEFASEGNVAAALRQYEGLWQLLGDDYDMEPAEETVQLIAEIKSGTFARDQKSPFSEPKTPLSPAASPGRLPMISVRSFVTCGQDIRESYMLEGFRRELIACLVRFREWVILEDEPATDYRRKNQTQGIQTPKGIDYELEGTYFQDADRLRLVITLKETESRRYIWSETLFLELGNWLVAQQEIVRRVSVAPNIYFSEERLKKQLTKPEINTSAYDSWLRGQELIRHWDPETELKAEALFLKIIKETPSFSPAYSSLASIYNSRHLVFPGVRRSQYLQHEALQYAKKSVQIDPLDTRSQLALAWSCLMSGRYDHASIYYGLSKELNPSDSATLVSSAHGLSFAGEHGMARDLAKQALDISPNLPTFLWGYLICINYFCGDYVGSIEAAERADDVISDLPGWKAAAYAELGETRKARQSAQRLVDVVSRKWRGSGHCDEAAVVAWFLHSFPIRQRTDYDRLRDSLRKAGLPVRV